VIFGNIFWTFFFRFSGVRTVFVELAHLCPQKYLTKISTEDATQYCSEITLCSSMRFFMLGDDTDCTSCTNFMADVIAIAQYDPNHFDQMFDAICKGLCGEVGGFESKICYSQASKEAETVRQAITGGIAPTDICQAIMFC